VVNQGSGASNYGLLSRGAGFLLPQLKSLSPRAFIFFRASELSAQISVARMKSTAFLRASTSVFSFYFAKENLKRPLLRPFKKEVYATPSSRSKTNIAS